MQGKIDNPIPNTRIEVAINHLQKKYSELERYAHIMANVRCVDVSKDMDFQRTFNAFYRVRRNAEWQAAYYELFEKAKQNDFVDYSSIVRWLFEKTGNIEASFSSKMLATLDPNMPIWDSIILPKLHLKPSFTENKEKRLAKTIEIYQSIVLWYQSFSQTDFAKQALAVFDSCFPEFTYITSIKKIDFLLWGSGTEQTEK